MRSKGTIAALLLLAVTAVWGATFVMVQDVTRDMDVNAFLFWRFGLAGLALLLLRPRTLMILDRRDCWRGMALGLMLALAYMGQTVGLQTTSATVAGFITGMFVVFTPLIGAVVLRRKVPGTAWWAVGLATVGLGFLSLQGWAIGVGELIVLAGAVMFALHLVFIGEWTSVRKAYPLTVIQLLMVALVTGTASLFEGGTTPPPTPQAWLATVFLALVATAAAFLIQMWAQSHIAATRTAVILTMEPVFAGIFGVLLAGDQFTWRTVVGGGLILAAMYVVELGPRAPKVEPGPHP